jgi:hypothetical protein
MWYCSNVLDAEMPVVRFLHVTETTIRTGTHVLVSRHRQQLVFIGFKSIDVVVSLGVPVRLVDSVVVARRRSSRISHPPPTQSRPAITMRALPSSSARELMLCAHSRRLAPSLEMALQCSRMRCGRREGQRWSRCLLCNSSTSW